MMNQPEQASSNVNKNITSVPADRDGKKINKEVVCTSAKKRKKRKLLLAWEEIPN